MKRIAATAAFATVLFALQMLPALTQTEWVEITASDGSFSFSMPEKVQEQRKEEGPSDFRYETLTFNTKIQSAGHMFIAVRTKYEGDLKTPPAKELQANAERFASRLKGKILSQKEISWKRGEGDTLSALDVSTETSYGTFRQLYVIEGNNVYALTAGPPKPENKADIERFFASLKIPKR